MCLETYTKNPLLSDLSGVAYFIWRRRVKRALPVTFELYAE